MEYIGILVIAILVVWMVVVAARGLVGKADPEEDALIDYDPDGVILLHRKRNK